MLLEVPVPLVLPVDPVPLVPDVEVDAETFAARLEELLIVMLPVQSLFTM